MTTPTVPTYTTRVHFDKWTYVTPMQDMEFTVGSSVQLTGDAAVTMRNVAGRVVCMFGGVDLRLGPTTDGHYYTIMKGVLG